MFAPDDPQAVVDRLADPSTRIVSLTITEGGYLVNQVTGEFDADDPSIQADLSRRRRPRTVFGYVTAGLRPARARARAVHRHVCDNLPGNGDVAARMICAFARLKDPALADWMEERRLLPQLHGRPHHAGHRRGPTSSVLARIRRRGRLAGGVRAVHPVGPRGPLHRRAARRSRTSASSWSTTSCPTS